MAKFAQIYLIRKRNTEKAVCMGLLLSRCTASAAMRVPLLNFVHTHQPAVDLVQPTPYTDALQ